MQAQVLGDILVMALFKSGQLQLMAEVVFEGGFVWLWHVEAVGWFVFRSINIGINSVIPICELSESGFEDLQDFKIVRISICSIDVSSLAIA